MHNFNEYFRKGGDFLNSYWAKWARKQVAFFHGRTVKGAESNIFTCKQRSIFKTFIFSHTLTTKGANSKAFTCKLRDNTTHSKGLITWAGETKRMNIVLPAILFLARFIPRVARQAWLLGKCPPGIPASQYLFGSLLAGLARLSYNRKVDVCCV